MCEDCSYDAKLLVIEVIERLNGERNVYKRIDEKYMKVEQFVFWGCFVVIMVLYITLVIKCPRPNCPN